MKRNKTLLAAVVAGSGALALAVNPEFNGTQPLPDYPRNVILPYVITSTATPELEHFIDTEHDLVIAFEAPSSRLRIDPRVRGVKTKGPYLVDVTSVKDGDTVGVTYLSGFCGWFPCPGSKGDIRIWALDSGETKTGKGQSNADCAAEREAGEQAKKFAKHELLDAAKVYAYNLRADPYNNRWVASIAYQKTETSKLQYFHIEALQLLAPNGKNVFAHYNPTANATLKRGGKTGFAKRKIWCD